MKSGRIPDLVIQDLIARTDLGALIGESVQLKRTGQNLSGLCPFHDEKTPSFSVSPIKNFYYCFGCAASGNALSFMMNYHHLSFTDACETLAQKLGIAIQYDTTAAAPRQNPKINQVLEIAKLFFQQQLQDLPEHHPVKKYLRSRTITQASIEAFNIGFAPAGWEGLKLHLHNQGISNTEALEAGLLIQGKNNKIYDRFRARIMFPIQDIKGQTIAFGGRVLGDETPKYLNSPESTVFQKRQALFGLPAVVKAGKLEKVLLTEGYLDVIRMHQVGLPYGLAALGTATSEHQVKTLFRLSDYVIACFDADKAGEKAAWRFLEHSLAILQSHQRIDFLFLPPGQDPDSFIAEQGKNAFLVAEKKTQGLSEFFITKLTADLQLQQLDDRAKLLKRALPLVSTIEKSLLRELLLQQLSTISQLPVERLETAMRNLNQTQRTTQPHQPQQKTTVYKNKPSAPKKQHQSHYSKQYHKAQAPGRSHQKLPGFRRLIDAMLRLLLQEPGLAQTHQLQLETSPLIDGFDLFHETYQQLQSNPNASLAYLMGLWHDMPQGQYISTLAAEEFLVPSSSLEIEFADGLYQLETLALDQALLETAQNRPIDKQQLQRLLEKKRQREHEKTTSTTVNVL